MDIQSERTQVVDERQPLPVNVEPQPVVPAPALAPPVAPAAPGRETVLTSHTSGITPSAIVAGIVAVVLLVVGGITAARAGVDGSLDQPIVKVAGFTATALLGIIEILFGLVLLVAALARSQRGVLFLGIMGGVLALISVFQPSLGEGSLAIERGFAVVAAIVMAVVVLATVLPTVRRRSVVSRTTDAG